MLLDILESSLHSKGKRKRGPFKNQGCEWGGKRKRGREKKSFTKAQSTDNSRARGGTSSFSDQKGEGRENRG